ncbi:MAG: hypothetical protein M1832_000907 [Thelocarpon impressellum]|nr:MAG: hypothetical protein M1832_000907 [Thelocarpon impressellum]
MLRCWLAHRRRGSESAPPRSRRRRIHTTYAPGHRRSAGCPRSDQAPPSQHSISSTGTASDGHHGSTTRAAGAGAHLPPCPMFGGATRSRSASQDPRLPRGECRFILLHPEINGQRCSCQGFWLNKQVLGSSCECGHQACYHEPAAAADDGAAVGQDEHRTVLARVAQLEDELGRERALGPEPARTALRDEVRALEEQLDRERAEREEEIKNLHRAIQGVYHSLGLSQTVLENRLTEQDDRIEGVMDKAAECAGDVRHANGRLARVEDLTMLLEDRLDELRSGGSRGAAGVTEAEAAEEGPADPVDTLPRGPPSPPVLFLSAPTPPEPSPGTLIATFVLGASQASPFPRGSRAYRRSASRGLHRPLTIAAEDAESVRAAIEAAFPHVLNGRPWMAMRATADPTHGVRLEPMPERSEPRLSVLQSCRAQRDGDGDGGGDATVYLALRDESLTWAAVRALPATDEDDEAWAHDELLDGPGPDDRPSDDLASPPPQKQPPQLKTTCLLKRTLSASTASASETASPTTPTGPKRYKLCSSSTELAEGKPPFLESGGELVA